MKENLLKTWTATWAVMKIFNEKLMRERAMDKNKNNRPVTKLQGNQVQCEGK